jgi:hypothetical protein
MERVQRALQQQNLTLTNDLLERSAVLHPLIDGVDATLIDLAAEELGEAELRQIAGNLAEQTYAAQQARDDTTALMRQVFELRADRIIGIRAAGRLSWVRETGTRARMLDSVEASLLPARDSWNNIATPTDLDSSTRCSDGHGSSRTSGARSGKPTVTTDPHGKHSDVCSAAGSTGALLSRSPQMPRSRSTRCSLSTQR